MTIDEFLKIEDQKKVHYFLQAMDHFMEKEKPKFKAILAKKDKGRVRAVITDMTYTFKIIGTIYFEGKPFFCDDCKEVHRSIVFRTEEVTDMSGGIINLN